MRVVCISDCHGILPKIPACDLLLIAGDICPQSDHSEEFQKIWLDTDFRQWLEKIPAKRICGVAGNHDFIFQKQPTWIPKNLRWIYLQDTSIEIDGMKIHGTPWQPWFADWAFNAPIENGEEFLATQFAKIPSDTDILISHGAPRGYGDLAPANGPNGSEHVGSISLLARIMKICPALVVYGHLHGGHGLYSIPCAKRKITLVNASVLDDDYHPAHKPFRFDIIKRAAEITISQVD
jgi:Icc-related predicted phosphoesterase